MRPVLVVCSSYAERHVITPLATLDATTVVLISINEVLRNTDSTGAERKTCEGGPP